jgi:putative endonuclease
VSLPQAFASASTPLVVIPAKAGIQRARRAPGHANCEGILMPRRGGYVYILASGLGGTLYIGVTNDIICRVAQHKAGMTEGFAKKYKVDRLVYYEMYESIEAAILREKQMKKWNRAWKIKRIEEMNPRWGDLYPEIAGA